MIISQAQAVRAFLVDVQIKGHPGTLQRAGEFERVLHLHRLVLPGVPDEARRRVLGHLSFVGKIFYQLGIGFFAEQIVFGTLMRVRSHRNDGIAQDHQIGPAALAFDHVRGVGFAGIKMRG